VKLHPRQFIRFIDGRLPSPTAIAFLPGHLGAIIACNTIDVQIDREYAVKILMKHKLKYEHFFAIQRMIERGWCVRSKHNQLEFYYEDEEVFGGWFLLVIKTAKMGTECWVVTFFRSNPFQIRSKLRRAHKADAIVRWHDGTGELSG
jgi:hypothetical protein